jgi:hypothetical protein
MCWDVLMKVIGRRYRQGTLVIKWDNLHIFYMIPNTLAMFFLRKHIRIM